MEEGAISVKKIALLSTIILIVLSPLACSKNWHVAALPPPALTPTPTATPTPVCGFNVVSLSHPLTPFPTPDIRWTLADPTPPSKFPSGEGTAVSWGTTFSPMTPTPSVIAVHDPFKETVIRTLDEWQSYYGSATPPVDFNTQMLLVYVTSRCCMGGQSITNVCETPDEVQLTMTIRHSIPCDAMCLIYGAVAVPKTELPVYITQIIEPDTKYSF
jgi:hypothetical protein